MSTYDGRKPEPPYPADLDQVIADIAAELGCKPDNEEILASIARLRALVGRTEPTDEEDSAAILEFNKGGEFEGYHNGSSRMRDALRAAYAIRASR